jgi:hypothetical protein
LRTESYIFLKMRMGWLLRYTTIAIAASMIMVTRFSILNGENAIAFVPRVLWLSVNDRSAACYFDVLVMFVQYLLRSVQRFSY